MVLTALLEQGWALPQSVPLHSRQEALVRAFHKLLPCEVAAAMPPFPMIEGLINAPPFTCYAEWRLEQDIDMTGPWGPVDVSGKLRFGTRVADGVQQGALAHKASMPQLVSYRLPPDQHFQASLDAASHHLPTEEEPMLDDDLRYAAQATCTRRGKLRDFRSEAIGRIKELSRRLQGVSKHLRVSLHVRVRPVLKKRHIALIMIGTIITMWSGFSYGADIMEGLPAVGHSCPCGAFPAQPYRQISTEEILSSAENHNPWLESRVRPS